MTPPNVREWPRWNGELIRVRAEDGARLGVDEIGAAWLFEAVGTLAEPRFGGPTERRQIGFWSAQLAQAFNLYNNPFPDPAGLAALAAELIPAPDVADEEFLAEFEGSIMVPLPRREP